MRYGNSLFHRAALVVAIAGLAASMPGQTIHHEGFEALRKGKLGNGGSNLFVSRQGRVEVINKFDLNNDGFNDVLISNDHDDYETVDAFVYWNGAKGFTPLLPEWWKERPLAQTLFSLLDHGTPGMTRLPAFGGGKSLIADLNGDGYPELVFCNYIHNYPGLRAAYIYWGSAEGYAKDRRTELPTNWAAGVAVADLNRDGFPDLVFANQGSEAGLENISKDLGLDSFVYWGSAQGFDSARVLKLPTHGARDVAIGDINGDGFPDIAFLNGTRQEQDVQVFFGGANGYAASRTQVIPFTEPTAIRVGDVNKDGLADVVVATAGGAQSLGLEGKRGPVAAEVVVIPGSAAGLATGKMTRLKGAKPRDVAIADLNRDGWPDIAVANSTGPESWIYWGSERGFAAGRRSALPTLEANGVAAADFNGDGFPDLVFANSNDGDTHDVPSYVYWGSSTGFAPYLKTDLQSFGAASVSAGDMNRDGRPEVVFINQYSGRYSGKLESTIFWGNPHHYYGPSLATRLPTRGAYDTTAADFNGDGYPDVVFSNAYIDDSYLYWGSAKGFSAERRQKLTVGTSYSSGAADLNGDGYLDLVFASMIGKKPVGSILWGSKEGFSTTRMTRLQLGAKRNALTLVIADFNRDGKLDLSFSDHYFGSLEIFWGSEKGYSKERTYWREFGAGGGLAVADLNKDGLVDFVVTGMFDAARKSYNTQTRVFLGTKEGIPSEKPIAELEGFGTIECAVADLNRDGELDLACTNYMSDQTRSVPMFVYWGQGGGHFSNDKRQKLEAESSAGVQTLDLNGDGYRDLIVHNHLKDGRHTISSAIYWNGKDGFSESRRTELPTFGPHFSQMVPAGNLMTRELEEEYISAPVELPGGKELGEVRWKAREPKGSKLVMEVRTAKSSGALEKAAWRPASQARQGSGGWVQYRARFQSADAAAWPSLESVDLTAR